LHLGRSPRRRARAEIRRDLQADVHPALQQQPVQLPGILKDMGDAEGGVAVEGLDQPPAFRRA